MWLQGCDERDYHIPNLLKQVVQLQCSISIIAAQHSSSVENVLYICLFFIVQHYIPLATKVQFISIWICLCLALCLSAELLWLNRPPTRYLDRGCNYRKCDSYFFKKLCLIITAQCTIGPIVTWYSEEILGFRIFQASSKKVQKPDGGWLREKLQWQYWSSKTWRHRKIPSTIKQQGKCFQKYLKDSQ